MTETTFEKKSEILADLWMKYRNEPSLQDFFEYNDVSLPLAFLIKQQIISEKNDVITGFIDEAFMLLLGAIGIEDDGFDNLEDILLGYIEEDN